MHQNMADYTCKSSVWEKFTKFIYKTIEMKAVFWRLGIWLDWEDRKMIEEELKNDT